MERKNHAGKQVDAIMYYNFRDIDHQDVCRFEESGVESVKLQRNLRKHCHRRTCAVFFPENGSQKAVHDSVNLINWW